MTQLVKAQDVAERYGLQRQTIYNLVCSRRIPFVKVGRALRFDEAELAKWEEHVLPIRFQGQKELS